MGAPSSPYRWSITSNSDDLNERLGRYIFDVSQSSIEHHGRFVLATSGGSLPKSFASALARAVSSGLNLRTECWHVFYADERHVALDSADSNHAATLLALGGAPWWRATMHPIDPSLPLDACANAYSGEVLEHVIDGAFDLVLLGMGPDGHTASLFPGHPLLADPTLRVAPISDSPKPPPSRVTLTLPLINASRAVAFVALGEGKAAQVASIAAGSTDLPSALVRQSSPGGVTWFLDPPSASLLPSAK